MRSTLSRVLIALLVLAVNACSSSNRSDTVAPQQSKGSGTGSSSATAASSLSCNGPTANANLVLEKVYQLSITLVQPLSPGGSVDVYFYNRSTGTSNLRMGDFPGEANITGDEPVSAMSAYDDFVVVPHGSAPDLSQLCALPKPDDAQGSFCNSSLASASGGVVASLKTAYRFRLTRTSSTPNDSLLNVVIFNSESLDYEAIGILPPFTNHTVATASFGIADLHYYESIALTPRSSGGGSSTLPIPAYLQDGSSTVTECQHPMSAAEY